MAFHCSHFTAKGRAEQSRAEQSRAEQSRAEQSIYGPILAGHTMIFPTSLAFCGGCWYVSYAYPATHGVLWGWACTIAVDMM